MGSLEERGYNYIHFFIDSDDVRSFVFLVKSVIMLTRLANKFAKFASFVSLTARDAFSTRPFQSRYSYQVNRV